jgi:mRNA interferase YafQ
MLKPLYSNNFKKDYKKIQKRGYRIELLDEVVKKLMNEEALSARYREHKLSGNYAGYLECHILPDWLLIYKVKNDELILLLSRTGTHADLF